MPPLPSRLRRPLTVRFQQQLARISNSSTPAVLRAWAALSSYDEDQIETFEARAAKPLAAAKFAAVRQAGGFYALLSGVRPVGVKPSDVPVVADTRAPFIATWRALKMGEPFAAAVASGAARSEAVVHNLVASASRQTGDIVIERAGLTVVGWERIPDGNACDWCLEVAPGFYESAESADFGHDRCGCSASPIYA